MAKRTESEKAEWRQKMKGYTQQAASLSDDERAEMAELNPIVTCEGHVISAHNSVFLAMQGEGKGISVTVIGGFQQWKKAGRIVKKSESAGYIHAPTEGKNKKGEKELRFRLIPMFDVSQTEKIEVEITEIPVPGFNPPEPVKDGVSILEKFAAGNV